MKKVSIKCKAADALPLDALQDFQKNLKHLPEKSYWKLRNNILEHGFSAPIFVWLKGDQNFILDGKQRLIVLKDLAKEGYEIPPLPVAYIEAQTEKEAKQKLLTITSRYGKATVAGLDEFLLEAELDLKDVVEEIDIEGIRLEMEDPAVEKEEDLEGFKRTHVLLTFHPDLFAKLQPLLEKILIIDGVEYEQASN